MSHYERLVQKELADTLGATMTMDRWELLRTRLASLMTREIERTADHAQSAMLQMELRHQEEMDTLKRDYMEYRLINPCNVTVIHTDSFPSSS